MKKLGKRELRKARKDAYALVDYKVTWDLKGEALTALFHIRAYLAQTEKD